MIGDLSKKTAAQRSILNALDEYTQFAADPSVDYDRKLIRGRELLKTINSSEGKDAIGKEEAERLGSMLEYQIFNFTQPGAFFGTDVEGFKQQVKDNADNLRGAMKRGLLDVEDLKQGKSLNLDANRAQKTDYSKLSDAEIDAQLAARKARR